jgi:hypothetical protein
VRQVKSTSSGVYQLIHRPTRQSYVGGSICVPERILEHRFQIQAKRPGLPKKYAHIFYSSGWEDVEVKILEFCPVDQLNIRERYWIRKLRPEVNFVLSPKHPAKNPKKAYTVFLEPEVVERMLRVGNMLTCRRTDLSLIIAEAFPLWVDHVFKVDKDDFYKKLSKRILRH